MDLNGLSQTVSTIGNYSQYVSGYMVMGPHYMVTNHYYSGTERIACKLVGSVDSSVDNSLELSGTEKLDFQIDKQKIWNWSELNLDLIP
ncbi:MAG: hypothetical protein IPI90_03380 [Saprospiraceae bacterium]|nr:hypothetical protein [Candidatus Vicinibacter affinis]